MHSVIFFRPCQGSSAAITNPGLAPGAIYLTAFQTCIQNPATQK